MRISLSGNDLARYVSGQLNMFFPDGKTIRLADYQSAVDRALDRVDNCFKYISIGHYCDKEGSIFNHLFSDQYAVFLWFLSNTIWQDFDNVPLLDKLFCLNKALHGIECMYSTNMPKVFFLSHTVGTVLGKAVYSDFLVISQGCTVGTHNGKYPVLGKGVALAAGASIIGECQIGDRVSVGSHTAIFRRDIVSDATAYRHSSGALMIKPAKHPYAQKFFNIDLHSID